MRTVGKAAAVGDEGRSAAEEIQERRVGDGRGDGSTAERMEGCSRAGLSGRRVAGQRRLEARVERTTVVDTRWWWFTTEDGDGSGRSVSGCR